MNKVSKLDEAAGEKRAVWADGDPLRLITQMSEAWTDWNAEVTRFAGIRLQRDIDFGSSLMTCKDVGELMNLQQQWVSGAFVDYSKEWPKLFRLAIPSAITPHRPVADR